MNARLDQLGQRIEPPPVTVTEGAPPVRPLGRQALLRVTQISPREFEDGPAGLLGRDADDFQFGDAGGSAATFPWIGALPMRQARLAVEVALAMLDRAERDTGGFRDTNTFFPGSGGIRRNEARIARRDFIRVRGFVQERGNPLAWQFLASIVWDIARAIQPGPFVIGDPGDLDLEVDTNTRRTRFYQEWWRLVMRRLAFSDVVRAQLTFKRTPRGAILRPRILGQLGQTVEVTDGAPSVRGLNVVALVAATRLSTAEFEAGPVARVGTPTDPFSNIGLLQADWHWPWTARPWVAALPPPQAFVAAETALAILGRRRGLSASSARSRFARARRLALSVARRGTLVTGREREFYDAIAEVVAQVAARIAPFADVPRSGIQAVTDRRTDFYQRWWRLVMRRLAFADVRRATVTIARTARGVIVRPAILGQLAGGLDLDRDILGSCFGRPS